MGKQLQFFSFMIEVIKPGLLTTVQDLGRWGYQGYGVGVAGAMDAFALGAANLLVGNPENAAGLEITLLGPTLRFHQDTLFAVTGADLDPRLEGETIASWTCNFAPSGSILSFKGRRSGIRSYLAVSGGINVPLIMGSRSTYLLGKFGGFEGRPLRSGDFLNLLSAPGNAQDFVGTVFPEKCRPIYRKNPGLRVIPGPFQDFFTEESISDFLSTPYRITPQSDRMGYRLQGIPLRRQKPEELITCGLANGTIQVPPDGQPILLLADRQTIGGYPIIATAIQADLPLAAQCGPGDEFRFFAVSPEEAREAYLRLWGYLKNFKASTAGRQLSA